MVGERKLTLHKGDVLTITADALVCPVNPTLDFSTGLASVVMRAAGTAPTKERPLAPEPYGKVVVLPGGDLNVKYIFFTVLYGERNAEKIQSSIRQAVDRAIRYAEFLRLKSIAFPVLGDPKQTPDYNYVTNEMLTHALQYFQRRQTKIKAIYFSAFNDDAFRALTNEAKTISE